KFLPILGAIAEVFAFLGTQLGVSDLLSWVTAIGLAGFVLMGLKSVIGWLLPALGEMKNMFKLLASFKFKEAFGIGASASGYEKEAGAVTKSTLAIEGNTVAKQKNAAASLGAITPGGNRADIARRIKNSEAVLAGGPAAMSTPYAGGTSKQTLKNTAQFKNFGQQMRSEIVAQEALVTSLTARNVELERKSKNLSVQKRKTLGAWEKAFGQKSLVGLRSPSEARALMKGANLADPMAWSVMFGTVDSMYLANRAKGKPMSASMRSRMKPGKASFLDEILLAAQAENVFEANQDKAQKGQRNYITKQRGLIADEITNNRKQITNQKKTLAEKKTLLKELKKTEGIPLGGPYATFDDVKDEELRKKKQAANKKARQQLSGLGYIPGGPAYAPDHKKTDADLRAETKRKQESFKRQNARMAKKLKEGTEGLATAGMVGSVEMQNAMRDRSLKAKLLRAASAGKSKGVDALSGIGMGAGLLSAKILLPALAIGAIGGLALWEHGKKNFWFTPNSELHEKVQKTQDRHLTYVRKEYEGALNREEILQKLKKKGHNVEAQLIAAQQRKGALGGEDGTGGLIGEYKAIFKAANDYTKQLKNTGEYLAGTPERLAPQLLLPAQMPVTDFAAPTGSANLIGTPEQYELNRRYDQLGEKLKSTMTELEYEYGYMNYAPMMVESPEKARGRYGQTPGGRLMLGAATDAAQKYGDYEKTRHDKGPFSWEGFWAGPDSGMDQRGWNPMTQKWENPEMAEYRKRGEMFDDLEKKVKSKTATPKERALHESLQSGTYVNNWEEAWGAGAIGLWAIGSLTGDAGKFTSEHMSTEQLKKRKDYIAERFGLPVAGKDKEVHQQNQINVKTLNVNGISGTPEEQQALITTSLTELFKALAGGGTGG
ncbi:MAG: hypothetical protein Q8M92_10570, partial [Candidatus Subteraquimicrobiales bacterium]|nr:hypothetical protein [Candidatus Subteraquimicrobiales bacterium]